jgi:prolyl-tRNA synthetase
MRTRLFLRTSEFLWQEGHTVHEDEVDAMKEVDVAVKMYRTLMEDYLAIPVIVGEKPPSERFPGAVVTKCLEAMMQDRKALQAGTSHYLGQNFAKSQEIKYLNKQGELVYAHTTSWGVSTRLIGGLIMTHGDDDGMRIPPKVAPKHVVIIPVIPKAEFEEEVLAYAKKVYDMISTLNFAGQEIRVQLDKRDIKGGDKSWQWIKKGIPLRIEVGPRDIEGNQLTYFRRDLGAKEKTQVSLGAISEILPALLQEIQDKMFNDAKQRLTANTVTDIKSIEGFLEFFTPKNLNKPEIHGGFIKAFWCEDEEITKSILDPLKVTIRE